MPDRASTTETAEAIRAAVARHPELGVDVDAFAIFAEPRLVHGGIAHLDDLVVVFAFGAGVPAAIGALERALATAASHVSGRIRIGLDAAELVQELRVHLLLGRPGGEPRLLAFTGRSSLARYLVVAATRHALNVRRARSRELPPEGALFVTMRDEMSPDVRLLVARYGAEVREAVNRSLTRLDARAQRILRLSVVEGATDEHVARLENVHRTTAARWVAAARQDLRRVVEAELSRSLGLAANEVSSLVRAAVVPE